VTTATTGGSETEVIGGRYRLGALLGAGGMADVHRATDEALHRQVAVKMLRPIAGGSEQRARFIAEARMLAGLSHTGLVTVLDAGFDAERPFLVMELVEGPNLAVVCKSPCDSERVESIGAQVAETLDFVHSRGIVHRDVKPGNVLLGQSGHVKLADFGIARLVDQDSGFTRTGFAMGTVAYASPEQVRGETVTGASDVYSFGLVLLEALTGRREFDGNDLVAAQARLLRPPRIQDDLPHNWPLLLREMTALDVADRPTAAQVAARIRSWHTGPMPATQAMPMDAATTSLLQEAEPPEISTEHPTPMSDRADQSQTRRAGSVGRSISRISSLQWALIAVGVAILGLLIIAGIFSGADSSGGPDLPGDTPTELRDPLADLHDAVYGGG
jgi:eukaryotic-like serine/threonine-protein kinase